LRFVRFIDWCVSWVSDAYFFFFFFFCGGETESESEGSKEAK